MVCPQRKLESTEELSIILCMCVSLFRLIACFFIHCMAGAGSHWFCVAAQYQHSPHTNTCCWQTSTDVMETSPFSIDSKIKVANKYTWYCLYPLCDRSNCLHRPEADDKVYVVCVCKRMFGALTMHVEKANSSNCRNNDRHETIRSRVSIKKTFKMALCIHLCTVRGATCDRSIQRWYKSCSGFTRQISRHN